MKEIILKLLIKILSDALRDLLDDLKINGSAKIDEALKNDK